MQENEFQKKEPPCSGDPEVALVFDRVRYLYGEGTPFEHLALDDVSFTIYKNQITGIIGHTGSGKSTLVQQMNGLLRPHGGRVLLNGKDIWSEPKKIRDVRFRVGLVFQYPEYQLFEETVRKDIAFGPKNMGLASSEVDQRTQIAASFAQLSPDLLDKSPFELSGGQKRRVAIAGVMAMNPEILVLDEPAAGLDPIGREEIFRGLKEFQKSTGKAVVIVSHSMEDMARYADRILVMNDAKLLLDGSCKEIFSKTELLQSVGLNIPQITLLLKRLAERGLPVPTDVFTVEEARDVLLPLLKGGRPHA